MIVVDSSVWISFFKAERRNSTLKLLAIDDTTKILVGDIVLLELLQGARDESHARRIETQMREFEVANMLDSSIAVSAARHYRTLRKNSITIRKTADLIIGTFCMEHGHELLQDNRDFIPMQKHLGLKLL